MEDKYQIARRFIALAKEILDKEGTYDSAHLANYMLRDLKITGDAGLSDLSWSMHRNNLHKNDVLFLIELLEGYLSKAEKEA